MLQNRDISDNSVVALAALDGSADAMIVVDDQGIVHMFNRAAGELLAWPPESMPGTSVTTLLARPEDGLPAFIGSAFTGSAFTGAAPNGPAPPRHFPVLRRADGTVLTVEARVSRIPLPMGYGYVATLRGPDLDTPDAWEEAETRLANIAANIPGIVFQRVRQPDGTFYYPFFSSGMRNLLGIEPEAMRVNSSGCLDIIHWADREEHLAAIQQSARDITPCHEEFRVITHDGKVRWLRGTSRPQPMPGGGVLWDGVLIDVTESRQAEQRLEMIMNHAYDSIVTIDADGTMLIVNAATEALFGYPASELIGRDVAMLMPAPYRDQHDAYIAQYLATGESHVMGAGPCEFEGQRKDGRTFPLELAVSEVRTEGRRFFIGVMRDTTRRKQIEAALHESEQRLVNIAANIPGVVFQRVLSLDGELRYTYLSQGCREVLGIEPQSLLRDSSLFLNCMSETDRRTFLDQMKKSAATLTPIEHEFCFLTPAGETRWLRGRAKPRQLDNGEVAWDGVTMDVTDRKRAEERLRFLAYYDAVTGVANRVLFLERFEQARSWSEIIKKDIAVLSVGIDRFNIINATLGHAIGDRVLAGTALRLMRQVNGSDVIARAGGDRFLVQLTDMNGPEAINASVEAIRASFSDPVIVDGQEFDLTVSIGVSIYPQDDCNGEALIKNAETALHHAKGKGPGSVQYFTKRMSTLAARTLSLQGRMRHALEAEQFVPYYQPQVELHSGTTIGVEALVRWIDPDQGIIPPDAFIPIAEEYGLIDAICEQVLRQSCHTIRNWQMEGLPTVPVAVNVSGRQFQNARRLMQSLETVLAETGLDPMY
ncbi:MAG: PAS domain S-box protein, partial [Alphaproteobacteria bacterium]|nr:PAS domain S-box protein [Alphaproteobacteria bacterium]